MISLLLALSCFPVDGPKLLARHVAAAVPDFSQLAPDTQLGFSPVPGAVRRVRAEELLRMASAHSLTLAPPAEGACFEWPMAPLDSGETLLAMRRSLPQEAQLEIVELSRISVPKGEITFPLDQLKTGMWRGHVRYGENGRYDIWARVRVTLKQTHVVAVGALKAGERISADQVQLEEFEGAPDATAVASLEQALGMVPKRSFAPGAPLTAHMLDRPPAILKGDTLRLHSRFGGAHISTEVEAQAAGKIGELIAVKNRSSGRILRARVESPGEVTLAQ